MIKNMTEQDYIQGAIKEVLRVEKERPNFTYLDYQEVSKSPYLVDQIRDKVSLKLNDVKKLAGLKIRTQRGKGTNNKNRGQGVITKRVCNMCEEVFDALDDMRSCAACNNLKNYSGGENLSGGMDEFNLGLI